MTTIPSSINPITRYQKGLVISRSKIFEGEARKNRAFTRKKGQDTRKYRGFLPDFYKLLCKKIIQKYSIKKHQYQYS